MPTTFKRAEILGAARTTRTGDFFIIQDETFFSINKFTFDQFAAGNYESITFEESGMMPVTNDANGNPRPVLKATKISAINEGARALKLAEIDTARLELEVKKIKKESKDLGEL